MKAAILLLAAGRGTRLGGEIPKGFLQLGGMTLLERSARRLRQVCPPSEGELIVLVGPEDRATLLPPLMPRLEALSARVVDGGETRQQSMQNGLRAASPDCDVVLVHDAARPFFPIDSARQCLMRAREVGAALLAVPASDTLKRCRTDGTVDATIDRRGVYYAQTPQALRRDVLDRANAHAMAHGIEATDDVALAEAIGCPVAVVPGSTQNLKITHPADLAVAEALLRHFET